MTASSSRRTALRSWIARALIVCASTMLPSIHARAEAGAEESLEKLATLDIDELLEQEVFSVSKKTAPLSKAAAAIFVLTQEDIRRSGASSIPEALRLVPELHVARISSHQWAVSVRGFNGIYANKLLVLIDGRTVYNSLFSGVFWDEQDTMIEDIERIEVIRGPGATLWGANAVNGIINIITKSAGLTNGGLATLSGGSEDLVVAGARYGGKLSANTDARAFVRGFRRDGAKISSDGDYGDDWDMIRGGFRLDSRLTDKDEIGFQGEVYGGEIDGQTSRIELFPPFVSFRDDEIALQGHHLIARWSRELSSDSEVSLRGFYDSTDRSSDFLDQDRDTYDLELQLRTTPFDDHELVWGAGVRYIEDEYESGTIAIVPEKWDYELYTAFVQDEIEISRDFTFVLGSKFEHNEFDGTAIQPSARASLSFSDESTIWAAISRASRSSSRANQGVRLDISASRLPDGTPVVSRIFGDQSHESETLNAYELGLRSRLSREVIVDLVGFYNDYPRLTSGEPGELFPENREDSRYLVLPITVANKAQAESYGGAAVVTYNPFDPWHLQASYSYLRIHVDLDSDSGDFATRGIEGENPRHMAKLRSLLNLGDGWELDSQVRYIDSIPTLDIDRYIEWNVRLGWSPGQSFDLSLLIENILHERHEEYVSTFVPAPRGEIERAVSLRATYRF